MKNETYTIIKTDYHYKINYNDITIANIDNTLTSYQQVESIVRELNALENLNIYYYEHVKDNTEEIIGYCKRYNNLRNNYYNIKKSTIDYIFLIFLLVILLVWFYVLVGV